MTLEEAIQHCEENVCDNSLCSMEHKQLAEWLKELQALKRNNNSIEERAKEHSKGQWDELTAKSAYIAGATEQKAIDIETACKACENELRRLKTLINENVSIPVNFISIGKSLSRIRLEMLSSIY